MLCCFLLLCAVIEHLESLDADCEAIGKTLLVHVVIGVSSGVIIVLKLMVESGDAGRSEARLRERCGVGSAAERRNPALLAGDIKLLSRLHEQVGDIFIRLDRAVEVAVVGHKILGIVNRIIREDEGRDIVELALMSRAPRLCAAQTRFLGAGEDNADFGVLKLDALFLESLEDGSRTRMR